VKKNIYQGASSEGVSVSVTEENNKLEIFIKLGSVEMEVKSSQLECLSKLLTNACKVIAGKDQVRKSVFIRPTIMPTKKSVKKRKISRKPPEAENR